MADDYALQQVGEQRERDWFLQFLVNLANKNRLEFEITLTVGGLLISGTLTGVRDYFDEMGAYFASPLHFSSNVEEVRETFKKIGAQCSCVAPSEKTETPSYIHLKNVRFFTAERGQIGGDGPCWWRGRLAEVQGFSPGLLA